MFFLSALFILTACPSDDDTPTVIDDPKADPYDVQVGPYDADIRWTSWGIPHILAEDEGSLGFGMGYAFARDHVCTLADQLLKIRSERAKYFGPGDSDVHLNSDFGWLGLRVIEFAEEGFLEMPEDLQKGIVGYAAGYNHWLETSGADGLPEPCFGVEWVKPINHIDLTAYYLHLGQFGSGYPFVEYIATASPPGNQRTQAPPPPASALEVFQDPPIASNGWALGSERTQSGLGALVSNTHFPAEGERQWHESHLTIPGKLNVYGASLMGVPLINIGFNEHVAWTHTVSNTPRFTLYQLDLHPDDPTRYRYGEEYRDMDAQEHTIEVLQEDGSVEKESRTLYRTHYGPMINAPVGGWTRVVGFSYRDVNENNLSMSSSFLGMGKATDLDSFKEAHREHMGIPWVHTMMADDQGNAFYADSAATPNLGQETEETFLAYRATNPYAGIYWDYGLWLGNGSDPSFEWVEDDRSSLPGAIPFDDTPQLLRKDFVSNANENYWLANPYAPLSGYPKIYGEIGTPRTPRTKMNNRYLMDTSPDGFSGSDGKFSLVELEDAVLDATGSLAQTLLAQVVERCTGRDSVVVSLEGADVEVAIETACAILAGWDGREGVDSVGATLWRELLGSEEYRTSDLGDAGRLFADTFDSTDPVFTPQVLASASGDDDRILKALARAVLTLADAGVAIDAPLGDVQFRMRGSQKIPTSGGPYFVGTISVSTFSGGGNTCLLPRATQATVVNPTTDLTTEGYLVNNGNSWVMVMEFTDDGPSARAVMTYSQSEDPGSPHFADQSILNSTETMRDVLFTEEQIMADPELEIVTVTREQGTF